MSSIIESEDRIRKELALAQETGIALSNNANAVNTLNAYESGWDHFEQWCKRSSTVNTEIKLLPTDDYTLQIYIGECKNQGLTPSALNVRLAAIKLKHAKHNYADPTENAFEASRTIKGYSRGELKHKPKPVKAFSTEQLMALVDLCDTQTLTGLRNRAILLVGFDGALRRSEIVNIDCENIKPVPEGIVLKITQSKSDQKGKGDDVAIEHRDTPTYCAINAINEWRDASGIHSGALFRRMYRRGKQVTLGETRLTEKSVCNIIKDLCKQCGITGRVGAHSLRSGYVTCALKANPADLIAVNRHVRHAKLDTTLGYMQADSLFDAKPRIEMIKLSASATIDNEKKETPKALHSVNFSD